MSFTINSIAFDAPTRNMHNVICDLLAMRRNITLVRALIHNIPGWQDALGEREIKRLDFMEESIEGLAERCDILQDRMYKELKVMRDALRDYEMSKIGG